MKIESLREYPHSDCFFWPDGALALRTDVAFPAVFGQEVG